MLCHLLECILTPENTPPDCAKEWYELYFVFCCVWAFGSCLFQDQVSQYNLLSLIAYINLHSFILIHPLSSPTFIILISLHLQLVDHRIEFTKWWVTEFKTIKFPSQGTVFDYYIDTESKKFEPWIKRVEVFELDSEVPLQV